MSTPKVQNPMFFGGSLEEKKFWAHDGNHRNKNIWEPWEQKHMGKAPLCLITLSFMVGSNYKLPLLALELFLVYSCIVPHSLSLFMYDL